MLPAIELSSSPLRSSFRVLPIISGHGAFPFCILFYLLESRLICTRQKRLRWLLHLLWRVFSFLYAVTGILAQELFVLSEQHSALQSKCCKLGEKVEAQRTELESMVKDRSQRMAVLRELEAERDRLVLAKVLFGSRWECTPLCREMRGSHCFYTSECRWSRVFVMR